MYEQLWRSRMADQNSISWNLLQVSELNTQTTAEQHNAHLSINDGETVSGKKQKENKC